ncbi:alpha/beta-hydrolase [Aspergillus filifer]
MQKSILAGLLALQLVAPAASAQYDPYFADLSWQAPRTLSDWDNLTVTTETGTFVGLLNDTYPNVRQFLRVPFAEPPVGKLRWMPPVYPKKSDEKIDSTFYGPSCPQFVSGSASIWNQYQPSNPIINVGEPLNAGAVAWTSAEDCLSLAIWTPADANKHSKLPVALFVTGGGGITGGVNIPSQLPSNWVSRSQEHIVVTINYRANIFGNPMSRALETNSLTLLDVRAAVEWVHKNIENFGGDRDNIMLWGQSQGSALTHMYTLAWPENPLVNKFGILSQPPSVRVNLTETPDPYTNFDTLAKALGCNYGNDSRAEFNCMQQISFVQIEETVNNWNATPSIAFNKYIPDEKYIFSNETERYVTGKVAKGPAIRSNTATELPTEGNLTESIADSLSWTCTNYKESVLRYNAGLDTYRYFYGGNFTNISPVSWLGAFHWSDLLMIFGTYRKDAGPVSQLEIATSEKMQDAILAFLKDPATVSSVAGWPLFNPNGTDGGAMLEFGLGVPVRNVSGDYVEAACWNSSASFPYNG